MYRNPNENTWKSLKVKGRAGNNKGKYKNWVNVRDTDYHSWFIDLNEVSE